MANTWDNRPINTGYTVVDGTTTGNYNNGHPETIVHTWMEYKIQTHTQADELANQTRIDIKLYSEVHSPQGSGSGMSVSTTENNYGYAGWDGANRTPYRCTYNFNNYARVTFYDGMITVPHNADGTKTITLEAGFTTMSGTWAITGGSASASVTLPTIANKTEILSVSGTNFGFATTVQLSRKASNLRENAVLSIGGTNIQLKSTSDESADFTFTLARSYAPTTALPCALTGTLTVETFNGSTSIGSVSQSVTFTVSQNDTEFAPTLTTEPTVEAYNPVVSALGTDTAVATYSQINVKAQKAAVSLKYGATITQRYVEFQDGRKATADQTSHTSNVINSAGSYGWRYVVIDSRGFSVSRSGNYQVINASMPTVEQGAVVYRGESDGTPSENGTYIFAQATAKYDSLNGHNSATMTAQVGAETPVTLTDGVMVTLKTDAVATSSYSVVITVTDILASNNIAFDIPSATIPFHIMEYGHGVGIGKYCENINSFEVGWDTEIDANLVVMDGNISVIGSGSQVSVNGLRVLTEADYPVKLDLGAEWRDYCYTTLSPSNCSIAVPANREGLYAIKAKCMNDNGTPQELVIIKYESGATNIEQIVRQEMGATGLGSCSLNASAIFRVNGGDTIQIYCRYDTAGTNDLYLEMHQIGH